MNFKDIHIGKMIEQSVIEYEIEMSRICNFMNCSEEEVKQTYQKRSIDTENLLRWSKLVEYDFFRVYNHHLILYAPQHQAINRKKEKNRKISLPQFRKNVYTKEVIDFILEQIETNKMTKNDVIERYRIPKTTLYKWIKKYVS